MRRHASTGILLASWGVVLLAVAFTGAFGLHRFYDDWLVPHAAAVAVRTHSVGSFLLLPLGYHWSPLWNLFALLNGLWVGPERDALIRGCVLAADAASLAWCVYLLRRLRASAGATALAMAVVALHPVNAAAIYSFDTYSQVAADLATWIAGGLAYLALIGADGHFRDRRLLAACAIAVAALFMKEQALTGVGAVLLLVAAAWWLRPPVGPDRRRAALVAAVLIVAAIGFASARRMAGARFDEAGEYRLCPACAPGHAALIGGALALPARTLAVVDAWRAQPREGAVLAVAAAGAAAVCVVLLVGLWRRTRRDGAGTILLAALLAICVFPAGLLGGIGELHAHTGVFWVAVLLALAVDEWRRLPRVPDAAWWIAGSLYVVALAIGLRHNLADMRATGQRSDALLRQYDVLTRPLPPGATVLVRGAAPLPAPGHYSLYRMISPERLVLMWLWAARDPADGHPRVVLEWANQDPARTAVAARSGRLFELGHEGDRLWMKKAP